METTYINPMPFNEALAHLSEKQAVGTPMNTAAWQELPVAIRQRAFFSATLTSAKLAQEMQDYIADFLSEKRETNENGESFLTAQGRDEFVAKFSELLHKEGFGRIAPDGSIDPHINHNSLRDLRSARRLQLIFDTQTTAAYSYARYLEGQDEDILDVFPCSRFIRVHPVNTPRPYHQAALGQIRRKDDLKFWLSLNRDFGVPWAPWGFNSGCDVEDVDRDEAIEAGILKETETVKPVIEDFNKELEASVAGLGTDVKHWIRTRLGKEVTHLKDGKISYTPQPSDIPYLPQAQKLDLFRKVSKFEPISEKRTIPKTAKYKKLQKERIQNTIARRNKEIKNKFDRQGTGDFTKYKKDIEHQLTQLKSYKQRAQKAYRQNPTPENKSLLDYITYDYVELKIKLDNLNDEKLNTKQWDAFYSPYEKEAERQIRRLHQKFLRIEGLYVPVNKRGHLQAKRKCIEYAEPLTPNVLEGIDIFESIVPKELFPKKIEFSVESCHSREEFQKPISILCNKNTKPQVVLHELAHAVGHHHKEILRKEAGFLYCRTKGDSPLLLKELYPNSKYETNEYTLKDKWKQKGGADYVGKIYLPDTKDSQYYLATEEKFVKYTQNSEILSMGLQRMLENPIAFKKNDPEYFYFIKNLLKTKP